MYSNSNSISISNSNSNSNSSECYTPGLHYKIPVFSDPAPGKYYAATYEQMGSRATQPLAKILRAGILLWRPGVM